MAFFFLSAVVKNRPRNIRLFWRFSDWYVSRFYLLNVKNCRFWVLQYVHWTPLGTGKLSINILHMLQYVKNCRFWVLQYVHWTPLGTGKLSINILHMLQYVKNCRFWVLQYVHWTPLGTGKLSINILHRFFRVSGVQFLVCSWPSQSQENNSQIKKICWEIVKIALLNLSISIANPGSIYGEETSHMYIVYRFWSFIRHIWQNKPPTPPPPPPFTANQSGYVIM